MTLGVILIGLVAASAEILGGVIIARRGNWPVGVQTMLLALGAGFMLALVFLKLLPAAHQTLGSEAFVLVLGGYAILHFFEHTIIGHFHFGEEIHSEAMATRLAGLAAFVGLSIHAFFDGLSISAGFSHSVVLGTLIACAITLHKFPEGLTVGSVMHSAGFSRTSVVRAALGTGAATMVGVLTVLVLPGIDEAWLARIIALSAGSLLYVGASDLIPEINKSEHRVHPIAVFGGILLYFLTDLLLDALMR